MIIQPLPAAKGALPGHRRISARIEYETAGLAADELWFEAPEDLTTDLSATGTFWLPMLLPLACRQGERVRLELPVDPVYLRNAQELMRIWARWYRTYRCIPIEAPTMPLRDQLAPGRAALFFSGGVDSFFTLLHYDDLVRTKPLPDERVIEDLILIWGFDIPLSNRVAFDRLTARYAELAGKLNKRLITVATNLRETHLRTLGWAEELNANALGSVGLLLEPRLSKLFVSAHSGYEQLRPWGSHPLTDPLISTSRTQCVHHGCGFERFDKVAYIAESPLALENLRVCWRGRDDQNCGVCPKCLRTQAMLEVLGRRAQATTFPPAAFSLRRLRRVRPENQINLQIMENIAREARQRGRGEVAQAMKAAMTRGRRLDRIENTLQRLRCVPLVGSVTRRIRKWIRQRTLG